MIDADNLEFIPATKFIRNCSVMMINDCPLDNEIKKGIGFSSQTAKKEFESLQSIGIPRGNIHATYCFNFRPEGGELGAIFWRKGLPTEGYIPWGNEKNCFILDYAYNELLRLRAEIQQCKPSLIICNGKWSLFFLTCMTSQKDTAKSSYGTLMKWRASSMALQPWWEYSQDCVVMPILPLYSKFQLPGLQYLITFDLKRLEKIFKAIKVGNIGEYLHRVENFIEPSEGSIVEFKQKALQVVTTLLEQAEQGPTDLAIDVETSSYAYIDCIGIAWSKSEAICIPFSTKYSPNFFNERDELEVFTLLYTLLTHPNVKHIGQNYSYDIQYLWRNILMKVFPDHDTMIANHVLFSTMDKNLGFLSSIYCKVHYWWKDEGKTHKGATDKERWIYNCRDCCTTYEIAEKQKEIYANSSPELNNVLYFQTKELVPAVNKMTTKGIILDTLERDRQIIELSSRANKLINTFKQAIGEDINLNSPLQLKTLFYDLFKVKKVWKKVTDDNGVTKQVLSLDEETLTEMWETELLIRPFIDILLDYKRLTKTVSGLKALTLDTDGRLRCSYNICGTDTYRFSSGPNAFGTGTNLQVISKGKKLRNGEKLPNSKKLFLPEKGKVFFDIDLSAADARIVASIARCNELLDILESGEDLYTLLAREFYRDKSITKEDDRRQKFKLVTHAGNYLGSAATIAARTGLLVIDVERVLGHYFGRFPEIENNFHKELKQKVKHKQRITNVFGYQRWFFDQSMPTLMQVAAAWEPQSTVAGIINRGMVNIHRNLPEVDILMQTHDSLAGMFPIGREDLHQGIIDNCSILLPYERPMTIPVDIKTSGKSWGDC